MPDDITNPNGTGADTTWTPAPASDTPPAWTDKKPDPKSDTDLVPSRRLKEEADKRRELENKVKEFEAKDADREKKNLEKQGKYKEFLMMLISRLKPSRVRHRLSQNMILLWQLWWRVNSISSKQHLVMRSLWSSLIYLNLENLTPLQKLQTLPKLKELMGEFAEKKPDPKWGHSIPQHDTNTYDKAKSVWDFNGLLSSIIGSAIKK
jgi:hypothetical protein